MLSGTEFDLTIDSMSVDFTGKRRTAMAINGSIPGPLLRWREGDTVTLRTPAGAEDLEVVEISYVALP